MKRFPIFRKGRHTARSGATLDFSESALRDAVAAYDPKVHEAPIVVGHPKDNHPAYGWVGSLAFDEATGEIVAEPAQVDADFAEMVQAGRFKKRSASWYLPDAPGNPKPGTLYLRHVGFLGAQPPAVKGLRDVSFSEADGVIEFSDYEAWGFSSIASLFRGLREWIIAENGVDAADKAVPGYLIGSVDDAAKQAAEDARQSKAESTAGVMPAFSEDNNPMTIAELQAQVAALTAENATLKANQKPADFAEREAGIAAREAKVAEAEGKLARAAIEQRVDAAIAAGKLLKGQRAQTIAFAVSLADAEATVDFGEGDKANKVSQREAYLMQLEAGPAVVDFGQYAPADGGKGDDEKPIEAVQKTLMDQVATGGKAKK